MSFTDEHLTNLVVCVDFTRRNAPLSGDQVALIGTLMSALEAEIVARKLAAEADTKEQVAA